MKRLEGKIVDVGGALGIIRHNYGDSVVIEEFPFEGRFVMPVESLEKNHILKRLFTGCDFSISCESLDE